MKLFEITFELYVLTGLLLSFTGAIFTYLVGKMLIKNQKDVIFDEILDYLSSPEGQLSVRNLGQIFAQGIAKGIGIGGLKRGGKTFGIPNEFLMPIVEKIVGKIGDKAITKETSSSSSDPFGT